MKYEQQHELKLLFIFSENIMLFELLAKYENLRAC